MHVSNESTVFDVLAILCSRFNTALEREYSSKWSHASEAEIEKILTKYKNLLACILNSSCRAYTFSEEEIIIINQFLTTLSAQPLDELYLLTIQVEGRIDIFSNWQRRKVIDLLAPLNSNHEETGISIYPHFQPFWNTAKSERYREYTFNSHFRNYHLIRKEDALPFEIAMYFWNDTGLLHETENGLSLRIAMSPVTDAAQLKTHDIDAINGKTTLVDGLENECEVTDRVLKTFDEIFSRQYSIIIFPEMIGTPHIADAIKQRMRMHPEYCTFVLLPTYCTNVHNTLVVLGPGGVELLQQNKGTAFVLRENDSPPKKEYLEYSNRINVLITQELGNIVFPICAELLEPIHYNKLVDAAHADTILCPSFSPGYNAFASTLLKGIAPMLLSLWINTCSAKSVSCNGKIPSTLGVVQLPVPNPKEAFLEFKQPCNGLCSDCVCYLDLSIYYQDNKFYISGNWANCA